METVSIFIERFQLEAEGGKLAKRDGGPLSEHTVGMTVGAGGEKEPPQVPEPSHHQSQRAALPVTRGAKFLWAEVAINVLLLDGKHTETAAQSTAYRMGFIGDADRGHR